MSKADAITMTKAPRAPERMAEIVVDHTGTDQGGRWLTLIGGDTSADDIEAFFEEFWPDVQPEVIH
jgi:hypothetical protein